MWQSAGRIRYRKIRLEDGCLKADDAYEVISPFSNPNLPFDFAKVDDLKSALKFELRYAPLNYDSLLDYDLLFENLEKRKGGDPVKWVLEHACFVRFALDLIYALAYENGRDALSLFHKFVVYKDYSDPALRGTGDFKYPRGAKIATTMVPAPKSESDTLWAIPHVIAILVNANTKNIHQELMISSRGRIMSVQMYQALIEAIWSMVGNLAMKAQQEGERIYFNRCEWCNSVFIAKDKRQRFCPPIIGKESLCGLKFRQRKCQANKGR